jgi:sorbitol/mannitol transport system permease protein
MIKHYFEVGMMFGLINILKVFGLVFVTTQGGPGVSSANLPYYVYRTAFYDWQMGRSAAIAVVTVAITLIVIQSFSNFIRLRQRGAA